MYVHCLHCAGGWSDVCYLRGESSLLDRCVWNAGMLQFGASAKRLLAGRLGGAQVNTEFSVVANI